MPCESAVYPSPPVNMKSLVTIRTVSASASGAPPLRSVSITGVVPEQWYAIVRPATCGKRPVATWVLHAGLKPFSSAARSCAPVIVSITV